MKFSTSRNEGRQKEQYEAIGKVDLSDEDLEKIAQAGKGMFKRCFMQAVWDKAKP